MQPRLFDEPGAALQTWRLSLPCWFGHATLAGTNRAVGWFGRDHCWDCAMYKTGDNRDSSTGQIRRNPAGKS